MNKSKLIAAILLLCITLPIWFYLMYVLLKSAQVDRLVWFLYWIYVPLSLFVQILYKIGEAQDE